EWPASEHGSAQLRDRQVGVAWNAFWILCPGSNRLRLPIAWLSAPSFALILVCSALSRASVTAGGPVGTARASCLKPLSALSIRSKPLVSPAAASEPFGVAG